MNIFIVAVQPIFIKLGELIQISVLISVLERPIKM